MKKTLEYQGEHSPCWINADGREQFTHGSDLFPMSVHRTRYGATQNSTLPYHWHEELELFYLHTGELSLQVGKQIYQLKQGDIALIPVGTPHGAVHKSKKEVDFYAFMVHMNFLSSFQNDCIQQQYLSPIFLKGKGNPVIFTASDSEIGGLQQDLQHAINYYINESFGYELALKATMLMLFAKMVQLKPEMLSADHSVQYAGEWVQKLFNYIQNNYTHTFSLNELAAAVNMSEGYLCRSTKKFFQQSPMEIVNQYRLSHAVVLLEQTNQKISYIAEETGFCNINRFILEFKKHKGCTPRKYRQQVIKEKEE